MNNYLYVFIGGGFGSLARYFVSKITVYLLPFQWPFGTFISNITSSFILGLVIGITLEKSPVHIGTRLLLITGFCGGFSTFSAFSFETFEFIRNGQSGLACIHIGTNVIFCLLCVWAGLSLSRQFI
jgi:CrcB protein